ncbi:MAG: phage virion morphogenesis protein [Thiothrix sp.]|uniref:phage virion morphogenesis protein n=1 Tax=Thiothrix sp. TaxID=1032 RepID=UPI00261EEBE8|nr:phage virion morphogenesis protein [Thiothrix sp.]MDD5395238.1 phage virion morphogenesis protein [Thiothrix sp.]
MAEIRVTIPNIPGISERDIQGILEEGGDAIINVARLSFVDASTPTGEKWPALSEVTIKRRRNGSDKPLRDTGVLMNSLQSFVQGNTAHIGSHLIYSNIHNYGGMAGRGRKVKIPQRRYMPDPDNLPNDLTEELQEISVRRLMSAFGGAAQRG